MSGHTLHDSKLHNAQFDSLHQCPALALLQSLPVPSFSTMEALSDVSKNSFPNSKRDSEPGLAGRAGIEGSECSLSIARPECSTNVPCRMWQSEGI